MSLFVRVTSLLIFLKRAGKRCTYTREALVNVTSNFHICNLTFGGASAVAWFFLSVLKLGDIFI